MNPLACRTRERINDEVKLYWTDETDHFDLLATAVNPAVATVGFDLIGVMGKKLDQDQGSKKREARQALLNELKKLSKLIVENLHQPQTQQDPPP